MPKKKKLSGRHIGHLGYTIPGAAEELEVPEGTVRRAVKNGEIEVVPFGGLPRIPPREIERLRNLFKVTSPV
jgi:excisionase family DNA binding protein